MFALTDNGRCIKCDKNCLTCDPKNINSCLTCSEGQALDTQDNTCQKCAKECDICDLPNDNTSCIICKKGFKFDTNGVCKRIFKKYNSDEY